MGQQRANDMYVHMTLVITQLQYWLGLLGFVLTKARFAV